MSQPNWGHLVASGRARGVNQPWTEEEANARAKGVPAELVRQGILTVEEEQPEKDEKPKKKK